MADDVLPTGELLGDTAILFRFGAGIDAATCDRIQRLAASLIAAPPDGLLEVVPSFASLALVLDPRAQSLSFWSRLVGERLAALPPPAAAPVRTVTIPVCYVGDCGPDLAVVARHVGLSEDEVVRRHAAGRYQVALLGFQPGFPYLLGLEPRLAVPRRPSPRVRVAAGSVAIGGAQTGIYPRESPGGWHVIGRTAAVLFDERREPPALLRPGDRVRFRPVAADQLAASPVEVA